RPAPASSTPAARRAERTPRRIASGTSAPARPRAKPGTSHREAAGRDRYPHLATHAGAIRAFESNSSLVGPLDCARGRAARRPAHAERNAVHDSEDDGRKPVVVGGAFADDPPNRGH